MQRNDQATLPRRPPSRTRRLILTIIGWTFVLLGIAGIFLPVLQGLLFLAIGLYLLSLVSPRARLLRLRLGQRFPRLRQKMDEAREWVRRKWASLARKSSL